MNFCWSELEGPIVFDENHPAVLTVEKPEVFTGLLMDLQGRLAGYDSECNLYERNEPIHVEKRVELITDPFAANPNQRKVLNALYALVAKEMWVSDNYQETNEFFSRLQTYLLRLTADMDYPVVFSEQIEGAALFKACDMQLEVDGGSLVDRLDSFMSACQEFMKKDVFFFVNLHAYLSQEELRLLYKSAAYRKCKLFLLEAHQPGSLPDEIRVILDKDLCQLNLSEEFL